MLMLFHLLCGHALADFALQSNDIAQGKNRNIHTALFGVPWYYWLTAHALIHGGTVAVITDNTYFGIAETVLHWAIDFYKCEKRYGIHDDQLFHVLCKVMYCLISP